MPRAALLSLHARIEGSTVDVGASRVAQAWGPRYQVYVVAKRDFALFMLGRLPENGRAANAPSRWRSGSTRISATGG